MKRYYNLIIISTFVMLMILTEYGLSFYGKGNVLFSKKITFGYNTEFDNLEGFKIEEDGIIQVIGHGTIINNKVSVNRILKYSYNSKSIFCQILDDNNKKVLIEIVDNPSGELGHQINYKIISNDKNLNYLLWFNVYNSNWEKTLIIINLIFKIIILIYGLFIIIKKIK